MFAEIRLESRVKRDIAAVIQDQVELDLLRAWPRHIGDIEFVSVGRQQARLGARAILPVPYRVRRQRGTAGFAVGRTRLAPIGLPRTPFVAQAFGIGVSVLGDDRRYTLRMLHRQTQADGSPVVEDVKREPVQVDCIDKPADYLGQGIEAVRERSSR